MSRQRRRSKSTQNPCQPSREAPSPCQSLISCCSDSSTANSPRIRLSHSSFATPLLSPVHSRLILCPKQSCTQSKSEARLSSTQDPVLWEPLLGAADGLVLETLPGVLGLACPVSEGDPGLPTTSPFPWTPFPTVITAMDVPAGKVSSEVHAGSFCVNLLTWTHLFPNQNTDSFLRLGPNLLNSCIIETDYLCFPARQFVAYCFGGDTGLT